MTASLGLPVVWRSALEARHQAIGARWLSEHVRWPANYADLDAAAESAAVAAGAGLAEIGPLEEWLLRGPDALAPIATLAGAATRGLDAPGPGRVVRLAGAGRSEAWVLGPDEVLVVAPSAAPNGLRGLERLAADGVSVIEMTGARTTLQIAGPAAPAILAELCPVDTTPTAMAPGDLIQAPLASARAFIARRDTAAGAAYTIMIARDEATYVWDALVAIGKPHGLVPVGPAALVPASSPEPERRRSR